MAYTQAQIDAVEAQIAALASKPAEYSVQEMRVVQRQLSDLRKLRAEMSRELCDADPANQTVLVEFHRAG